MQQRWGFATTLEPFLQLCNSTGSFAAALEAFFTAGRQHWGLCGSAEGFVLAPAFVTALKPFLTALDSTEGFALALKAFLRQHWRLSSHLCDSTWSLATALRAVLPGGRQHRGICNHTGGLVVGPAFVTAAKAFYTALRQHWELCDSTEDSLHSFGPHWDPCDSTESFLHNCATALGALRQH